MRIIHTSDWHLGQNFMGKSRAPEHRAFFSWLLDQIETNKVDALIVAGDIFDSGTPPSYARELYNRFVVDLQKTDCQLVLLAGNHDSVATLNESRELLACLNTHVVSCVMDSPDEQIIPLKKRSGNIGAIFSAVPFIRPRDVMQSHAGQSAKDKQQTMQTAIASHYQRLFDKAVALRDKQQTKDKTKLPIITSGHLTTVGASTSDSVREIYIGTLEAFPASGFPPADYIALGHIHQSQKVAKSTHIRYSGSPIPLSFDEAKKHDKSVLMVDFKAGKLASVKALKVPVFQYLQVVKGNFEEIEKQLGQLAELFKLKEGEIIWVEITITSQDYLPDLQNRLQAITEKLPIDILRVQRERNNKSIGLQKAEKETLDDLGVEAVFERRLAEEEPDKKQNKARLKRIKQHFKKLVDEVSLGDQSQ